MTQQMQHNQIEANGVNFSYLECGSWHSPHFADTLHKTRALAASIDCDATSSNQDKSMA
jgi:hypothetical protein